MPLGESGRGFTGTLRFFFIESYIDHNNPTPRGDIYTLDFLVLTMIN